MSTLTVRLPDERLERLKAMAESQGISLNKLLEAFSTKALAEFDAETRFKLRAARGAKALRLDVLDTLDKQYGTK